MRRHRKIWMVFTKHPGWSLKPYMWRGRIPPNWWSGCTQTSIVMWTISQGSLVSSFEDTPLQRAFVIMLWNGEHVLNLVTLISIRHLFDPHPVVDFLPSYAHVLAVENYKVGFRLHFEIKLGRSLNKKRFHVCRDFDVIALGLDKLWKPENSEIWFAERSFSFGENLMLSQGLSVASPLRELSIKGGSKSKDRVVWRNKQYDIIWWDLDCVN